MGRTMMQEWFTGQRIISGMVNCVNAGPSVCKCTCI